MANESESSSPTRVNGQVQVPGSDLNDARKQTLKDYLKNLSKGSSEKYTANHFPIQGDDYNISNGSNQDGTPIAIQPIQEGQPHFSLENEARKIFNDISSGAFFDVESNTGNQISNIAAIADTDQPGLKNNQVFGHKAGTEAYVQTVSEQVSSVLNNNRWSPDRRFRETVDLSAVFSNTELERNHNEFVEENENYNQVYYNSSNSNSMVKIGAEAVLAGSGYIGFKPDADTSASGLSGIWSQVFDSFDISNVNAAGLGLEHTTDDERLRDGTRRVSEKATVPNPDWLERGSSPEIDHQFINNEGMPSDDKKDNYSYTVMNNMISTFIQEELFSNKQYVNSLTFMAAIFIENILIAAIFDALLLLEFAALPVQFQNMRSQYDNTPGTRLAKGKARGNSVPLSDLLGDTSGKAGDIMELFGLPDLQDLLSGPFLVEFILKFMGIDKPIQTKTNFVVAGFKIGDVISFVPSYLIGSLQTTISALKDPMSSGFFFNLGRQIARKSALDHAPKPEGGALEYITYFMKLRDKASFRFFVTMVNLGDNAIGQFYSKWNNYGGPSILNDTKIAWGSRSVNPASVLATPSIFIIPKSFQDFRKQIGVSEKFISGYNINSGDDVRDQFHLMDSTSGRLPDDVVDSIEAQLENEYMPFYIKDMRTNEIISFHAFLDSLTDGFSATYSSVQGLGRIEPAHIYESSSRSIGISFTMIAFSPEDMDMLYWKLNKLVTLLYPQFSKGTQLIGPDGRKFYMPFSQIPTASPMVRLRVGDVLTNNFSDASAARMLGLGDPEGFELEEEEAAGGGLAALLPGDPSPKELQAKGSEFIEGLTPTVDPFFGPIVLSAQTISKFLTQGDIVTITGAPDLSGCIGNVVIPSTPITPASVKPTMGIGVPKNPRMISNYNLKAILDESADKFKVIGFEAKEKLKDDSSEEKKDIIDYSKIMVWLVKESIGRRRAFESGDERTAERKKTEAKLLEQSADEKGKLCFKVPLSNIKSVESATRVTEESANFVKNNTVIKSFTNNHGEGIAGFIDNLQIDWQLNTIMWDTTPGKRAPQGCKITLGFKPIHDITPGIDADGFNRAPVYKVGNLSREMLNDGNLSFWKGE